MQSAAGSKSVGIGSGHIGDVVARRAHFTVVLAGIRECSSALMQDSLQEAISVRNLTDGDPNTYWESDNGGALAHPHSITIRLKPEALVG